MALKAIVTGVCGFIGSQLAERLLASGWEITGLDCFTEFYDRGLKERNLALVQGTPGFSFIEADVVEADLEGLMSGVDIVFHEAAQAGVRTSWGRDFDHYTRNNVLATQRIMEAAVQSRVRKVVMASSSSVYGDSTDLPLSEASPARPVSPYGVTKLAGEHLAYLYFKNYGLETVGLRYFTVYGPRQRPDMAFNRFIRWGMSGRKIEIYGDGHQSRDFTYVGDAVAATVAAAENGRPGVYNIGGGSRISIRQALAAIEGVLGRSLDIEYQEVVKGDVRHTAADTSKAQRDFGYSPTVDFETGIRAEIEWLRGSPEAAA